MDQLTMFETTESDVYRRIEPRLLKLLDKNWADSSLLAFEERTNYYSILFNGSVVARIRGGRSPYLEIPDNGQVIPHGKKNKNGFIKVSLQDLKSADLYFDYIEQSLQAIIDSILKEFSCCSRYMECSNNIKCVNPDKKLAIHCGYRKVLMSGKVFFGENRNVE